jgi:hypothetical protein
MGKFIKKKGYGARKRRDDNKEYVRRYYKCKSKDHVVADCPYNSDNDEDDKKKEKKERKKKKEKKEKKIFQKKRRVEAMWSLGIVMAYPMMVILVMVTRRH